MRLETALLRVRNILNEKNSILCLVGFAIVNGDQQAVILDKIPDSKFVFKNKQIKMAVDVEEAPEDFFFVHIRKRNDNPAGRPPSESDSSNEESN